MENNDLLTKIDNKLRGMGIPELVLENMNIDTWYKFIYAYEKLEQENEKLETQLCGIANKVESAFKLRFPHHGIFAKNYELFMGDLGLTHQHQQQSKGEQ